MELDKAILQIYPDIDLLNDVVLRDDGEGSYIAQWDDLRAQPTEAELQSAWEAYEAGALDRIKIVARQAVKVVALQRLAALDDNLNWGVVGTNLAMGEGERYLLAGRPVSPAPAQYQIAAKWRIRREETLAETLNWMADIYLSLYGETATIIDTWNGYIASIKDAQNIEDVQAIIDGLL